MISNNRLEIMKDQLISRNILPSVKIIWMFLNEQSFYKVEEMQNLTSIEDINEILEFISLKCIRTSHKLENEIKGNEILNYSEIEEITPMKGLLLKYFISLYIWNNEILLKKYSSIFKKGDEKIQEMIRILTTLKNMHEDWINNGIL